MLAEGFVYDVNTEKNSFESAVATATEAAKKKFEDSMKQKVVNQKVKARASKGQPGQPEKDYVIEKVVTASIDWYWKQYVVVLKDEKGKEYFLKPGFKVEVLSQAGQPGEKPTQQVPAEPAAKPPTAPSPVAPGSKNPAKPATGAPVAPAPTAQPKAKAPVAEDAPVTETTKEYKKEWAAQIVGEILVSFLSPEKQQSSQGKHPSQVVLPYIKSSVWVSDSGGDPGDGDTAKWNLEIPVEDMDPNLDVNELKLAFTDGLRSSEGPGAQYTRGYAAVQKLGRLYRMEINYTVGLDV